MIIKKNLLLLLYAILLFTIKSQAQVLWAKSIGVDSLDVFSGDNMYLRDLKADNEGNIYRLIAAGNDDDVYLPDADTVYRPLPNFHPLLLIKSDKNGKFIWMRDACMNGYFTDGQ